MGALIAALLALGTPGDRARELDGLLRAYATRPPAQTLARAAQLVDEGDFPGRDRAEYWLGSASLAAGDLAGARQWFERALRDYPGGALAQRSLLGLGDVAAAGRDDAAALAFYERAGQAGDAAVRELARVSAANARLQLARGRLGTAALAIAVAITAFFFATAGVNAWPPPAELRVAGPLLAVILLAASGLEAPSRNAAVALCGAAALLVWASGARLRTLAPHGLRFVAHVSLALLALACSAVAAVERAGLLGTVLETLRAGAE